MNAFVIVVAYPPADTPTVIRTNALELKTQQKLSYAQLATKTAAAGWPLSSSTISNILNGKRRIYAEDIQALAQALTTTAANLMGKKATWQSM